MSHLRTTLVLFTLGLLAAVGPTAAQDKPKDLKWTHAFDLAARKFGEDKFTKDTQKFGVEVFKDNNTGLGVYVSQTGSLAVGPGFQSVEPPLKESKGPAWLTGLDLPARKAGEKAFSKETKVLSLEVFRDPNVNDWVYVTEKANLAVTAATGKPGAPNSAPKWVHSFDLSCRKGGVKDWKDAKKFGVEVYRDRNTGTLLYVSETGAIAAVPETAPAKPESKAPAWLHGLDLSCRKATEPTFTKDTRKFGVEVFHDGVTGNLVFIGETGTLAVAPAPKDVKAPTAKVKEPRWTHGLNVKVRSYGEKDFSDKTKVFGAEVFRDENVGVTLYICETGSISAAPAK